MNTYIVKWFFSSLAFLAFVILSVFSLADVRWGDRTVTDEPSGIDVIFAIDVSRSMMSTDVVPTRLERSGVAVKGIMNGLAGSRFGVIIFKGTGVKSVPITEDVSAVSGFVGSLKTGYLSAPGTDIGAGIQVALASFSKDIESQKFVVLLSDGGATRGSVAEAIESAQSQEVTVISIGVGGEKLVPIPLGEERYVTDASGELVQTRLQDQELRRLANETGGLYLEIQDPTVIGSAVAAIRDLSGRRLLKGFQLVSSVRYRVFVFVALLLALLYQTIRMYRWKGSL
jgi:Ca-activated chloride channel family protein